MTQSSPFAGKAGSSRTVSHLSRMAVVHDTDGMVAAMQPCLRPGAYVFVSEQSPTSKTLEQAISIFKESEGVSMIVPLQAAQQAGLEHSGSMRCITLKVYSALDGIGLTAAVAQALTELSIPCNVVAAYHHDHVFVPESCADEAVGALNYLQARAKARLDVGSAH